MKPPDDQLWMGLSLLSCLLMSMIYIWWTNCHVISYGYDGSSILVTFILIALPGCMMLPTSPRFLLQLNLTHVLSVLTPSSIRLLVARLPLIEPRHLPLIEPRHATKGSQSIWDSWSRLHQKMRIMSQPHDSMGLNGKTCYILTPKSTALGWYS
jgi:hypothetical protein